jgi:septum formation protein
VASASAARRSLLANAGLRFDVIPAAIDEAAIKNACRSRGATPEAAALELAGRKAAAVACPGAMVIGADQLLVCEGDWFDKPETTAAARAQLMRLRGRSHTLVSACAVLQDGKTLFTHMSTPRLAMRPFSEAFLDAYLEREGEALLGCVGAYRLEGPGIQLFAGVDGDHSAILGLPLLPLLGFLRGCGIIAD